MFGKKPDRAAEDARRKQEAEQKQIETAKQRCAGTLEKMREAADAANPSKTEQIGKQLMELLKNPKLPADFRREVGAMARGVECDANMKATDVSLKRAAMFAQNDQGKERAAEITKARALLGKAVSLGAGDEFKKVGMNKIEAVMLTGGVKWQGPTRAKPVDNSPRPPNMAKTFEGTEEAAAAGPARRR